LAVISVALPTMIVLAVLAFAWPTARIAPRDLPVGIVGASPASQQAGEALAAASPGGFDLHVHPDQTAAATAVRHRDVYGAFDVAPTGVMVLEASAASPTVAQLLTGLGQQLAAHPAAAISGSVATTTSLPVNAIDVVPTSSQDPRGLAFSSACLPPSIGSLLVAAAVALIIGSATPGGRSSPSSWCPRSPAWVPTSLRTASSARCPVNTSQRGQRCRDGFIGNPLGGVSSAPQLLAKGVDHIGQRLPAGAGANLLRSVACFHGMGRPATSSS
jgi:hypothetical protein